MTVNLHNSPMHGNILARVSSLHLPCQGCSRFLQQMSTGAMLCSRGEERKLCARGMKRVSPLSFRATPRLVNSTGLGHRMASDSLAVALNCRHVPWCWFGLYRSPERVWARFGAAHTRGSLQQAGTPALGPGFISVDIWR